MYRIKVSNALKRLVNDTADACRISTAAVMRKVAMRLESGTIRMTAEMDEIAIQDRNGILHHVNVPLSLFGLRDSKSAWIKSEMEPPKNVRNERDYRLALAGACLDTMSAIHAIRLRDRYGATGATEVLRQNAAADVAR